MNTPTKKPDGGKKLSQPLNGNKDVQHMKWVWTAITTCVAITVFFFFVSNNMFEARCNMLEREMELRYETIQIDVADIKYTLRELHADVECIAEKIK
jgi:hypothetical protein